MSKTNKMSLGQLTLVTAVNMIGAGIIMLPSQLAQVGAVSVFAWIISTIGAMSLAYAFAKCGLYSKKQGAWADMLSIPLENPVISLLTSRMPYR